MKAWTACVLFASTPVAAQMPVWQVTAKPIAVIGTSETDRNLQLAGVFGARRLPDGRMVVADSASHEIRLYDATGKFLSLIGRKGQGPSEFRGNLTLYAVRGDSLLFYDDGARRWTIFSPAATLVKSWPATKGDRERFTPTEYRRTLIHPTGEIPSACYDRLIDALPMPRDTAYREMFPDGDDRAWAREEGASEWRVFALGGSLLARVTLPPQFELLQIGNGFVVGSARDADGVDRIEVLAVATGKHGPAPACASRPMTVSRDSSRIGPLLRTQAQQLQWAGEAYASDYGHYPATIDSMTRASNYQVAPGIVASLGFHAGGEWNAMVRTAQSPRFCRVLAGGRTPSWLSGVVFCGP
jgi:hypothetical protein